MNFYKWQWKSDLLVGGGLRALMVGLTLLIILTHTPATTVSETTPQGPAGHCENPRNQKQRDYSPSS